MSLLSSSDDIKLIGLVEQNRILYDTSHSKNSDSQMRDLVWQKIGEEIGKPDKLCKTRWVNMRDHLRRTIRKYNEGTSTGRYKYEEEMAFVIPFFKDVNFDDEAETSHAENKEVKDYNEKKEESRFTYSQDIALIGLVKERRHLYDPSDPKYMHKEEKARSWAEIAEQLDKTVRVCKVRWNSMKDTNRRKNKYRASSDHRQTKVRYKYNEELAFLRPFFNFQEGQQDLGLYLEENDTTDLVYDSEDADPRDVKFEFTSIDTLDEPDEPVKKKRSKKQEECDIIELEAEVSTKRTRLMKDEEYDGVDTFLMSIGSTLRQLKPYYRNQVKSKIFQVVQEYELKQIVETEGHPSSSLD